MKAELLEKINDLNKQLEFVKRQQFQLKKKINIAQRELFDIEISRLKEKVNRYIDNLCKHHFKDKAGRRVMFYKSYSCNPTDENSFFVQRICISNNDASSNVVLFSFEYNGGSLLSTLHSFRAVYVKGLKPIKKIKL